MLAVAYAIPLISTGDPLWPLPTRTEARTLYVYWEGSRTEIGARDRRYAELMDALNEALSTPSGIELRYGLPAAEFPRLRASGHAFEADYSARTRAHGAYALGEFTRIFVSFDGDEYALRLVFVGDEFGYRAGPLRARDLTRLKQLAEGAR